LVLYIINSKNIIFKIHHFSKVLFLPVLKTKFNEFIAFFRQIIPILINVDPTLSQTFLDRINDKESHSIVTQDEIDQYERDLQAISIDNEIKYTNMLSRLDDIRNNVIKPNVVVEEENDLESGDLKDYFKPLVQYNSNPYDASNGLLNQLLWLRRRTELESKRTVEDLFSSTNTNVIRLVEFIKLSLDKQCSFRTLSDSQQNTLINLITNPPSYYSKYALSLLVTFLMRHEETQMRYIGLKLIQTGAYVGDVGKFKNLNLKLYESSLDTNLIINTIYINLTFVKLSGLDIKGQLDLSGHDLTGLRAENTHFENLQFRYCSLVDASFQDSTLENCYFNNSTFYKCNFSNVLAEGRCHFDFCYFEATNMETCKFYKCNFDYADFDDKVSLNKTLFSNSDFSSVKKLKFHSTTQMENNCLISENVYEENLSFFRELFSNLEYRIETQTSIELPVEFEELLSNEKIYVTNFPANWPEHGWDRDSTWTLDEKGHKTCNLDLEGDNLAKFIAYFTHLTSDAISYAACKLEDARSKKALKDGTFWKFFRQEIFGSGPPSHEGRVGSITIKKVTLQLSPSVKFKLSRKRSRIMTFLCQKQHKIDLKSRFLKVIFSDSYLKFVFQL
jgi:uncharacterized protein YjbI with pentapeptide repeats